MSKARDNRRRKARARARMESFEPRNVPVAGSFYVASMDHAGRTITIDFGEPHPSIGRVMSEFRLAMESGE